MSCTSTSAQSRLLRSPTRNRARSRTMARAVSIVWSVRGSVPARRARCRARSMDSAHESTAGRRAAGVASMRRWRRPAASRSAWSVGRARPCSTRKSSRARARLPIDRPGWRARSSTAVGWLGCSSASSRPSVVIIVQVRPTQCRAARSAMNSRSHAGGSSSSAIRFSPWTKGRSGLRCQHAEHNPSPAWRSTRPQLRHGWGGFLRGRGREHVPHQPVASRSRPGRPQRGQGRWAARAASRRRQRRHEVFVRARTGFPQLTQAREQSTHRPVSACRTRGLPQPGQGRAAARADRRRQHRQHTSRPWRPTGAPHSAQSRSVAPTGSERGHRPAAGPGSLRLGRACAAGTGAGAAGRSTGVVSTSNRSFGVHSSAVHNAANVDSFTCAGSLANSADTDAEDSSSPARSANSRRSWVPVHTSRWAAAIRSRHRIRILTPAPSARSTWWSPRAGRRPR